MRDTGLLVAMLDEGSAEDIIDGNLGIYKGAIYENIIADIYGNVFVEQKVVEAAYSGTSTQAQSPGCG